MPAPAPARRPADARGAALRITLLYAAFGALWILVSDQVLGYFVRSPATLTRLQMIKGWAYVVLTAGLVYVLVYRHAAVLAEANRRLREREATLRSIFRAAPIGIGLVRSRVLTWVNERVSHLTGYRPDELAGRSARLLYEDDAEFERVGRVKYGQIEREGVGTIETRWQRKDGAVLNVLLSSAAVNPADPAAGYVFTALDVTERTRLEDRLRQAQKMEAIGQLAGGVAHDFNNVLTAILGNVELLRDALDQRTPGFPVREALDQIERAGQQAAALTRQLLTFSRKRMVRPELLDPRQVLEDLRRMLRRLIREDIALEIRAAPDLWLVRADPGQLEQVILNLVLNARDAMPRGGRLTVTLERTLLDAAAAARPDARPGPHVVLTVSDTGCGMDAETQRRAFEPFFTTKPAGQGTGLGLATVHGIVRQCGGHIAVESEPGRGSTFRVYLPALPDAAPPPPARPAEAGAPGGSETILVCEDDPGVRQLTGQTLAARGYRVLAAPSPAEALALAAAEPGPLDLLVVDVILPGMHGRELAERLQALRPGLRVLYVSGYAADVLGAAEVLAPGLDFLEKPYTAGALLQRVRAALDRGPGRARA